MAPPSIGVLQPWSGVFLPTNPLRALARGARALVDVERPFLAQLVVTRRCNLTCGYCNEYDDFSKPVPTEVVKARLDHLADLGTLVVTLTGGEPLLHPSSTSWSPTRFHGAWSAP